MIEFTSAEGVREYLWAHGINEDLFIHNARGGKWRVVLEGLNVGRSMGKVTNVFSTNPDILKVGNEIKRLLQGTNATL